MPLHPVDRQGLMLDGFDVAILFIPGYGYHILAQFLYILVMGVDSHQGCAELLIEPGVLFDLCAPVIFMVVGVGGTKTLGQGTAEGYVDDLVAPTDAQDRVTL